MREWAQRDEVLVLLERFEANHPSDPRHYYLSLLGTHPDHRGRGKGMSLLAANLAWIDGQGFPTRPMTWRLEARAR